MELRRLAEQLVAADRRDLLLKAIGVPLLEELRIEVARGELSRLVITEDCRFVLADYNNKEVELQPVHKAVYLLFLAHPEGIEFKRLADYREELLGIYKTLKPMGLSKRTIQSIEDVTNPLLNSINEKCARIRSAFANEVDEALLNNYIIIGKSGEVKKISLPRNLVAWK